MTVLRLGLLQYGVTAVPDLETYAQRLEQHVAAGARQAELLVMPEYACMEVAAAAGPDGGGPAAELAFVCARSWQILEIMRDAARKARVWLQPGTLPWAENGRVRNRAPLIAPDGRVAFQDKRVMTRFEAESWKVESGNEPAVFETPWGLIGIAICYDVEFPALVRAQVEVGAWLIVVPSCTDTMHGFNRVRLSARARALENQCFVGIAPTVGDAPWSATLDANVGYAGVYSPVDRGFPPDGVIVEGKINEPAWVFATVDPATLAAVRQNGAVRNYRDWPATVGRCAIRSPQEYQ
jgi:predicted amidohydrolase